MPAAELRVAVDLGATNVDAVALDAGDHVVARVKVPRRRDAEADVHTALRQITAHHGVAPAQITRAMLGSRAALEAVVARRGLCRTAVVRIGAPLTTAVPPLATWPDDLRAAVSGGEAMVRGGARFDGRPDGPLDTEALAAFLARVAGTSRRSP